MRARVFAHGGELLATVEIDESKLSRPVGPVDRMVVLLDEPQARPGQRRALMLEGRLETVR